MKSIFKNIVSNVLVNILGKCIDFKTIIFESDDWGTIRMASKKDYEYFKSKGFGVENCPFNRYDTLECNKDIDDLANVLSSFKDIHGQPAKFTLNQIVANPDFGKIKDSDYKEYFYESVTKTYQNYPNSNKVIEKIKECREESIFDVQFHGREHINVQQWIRALKDRDTIAIEAFRRSMFSLHNKTNSNCRTEFLESFGEVTPNALEFYDTVVGEGINMFKNIFGKEPISFIAPCYIWPSELERKLSVEGIKHIQSAFVQKEPVLFSNHRFKKIRHIQGSSNKWNQIYTVRNILFEPSIDLKRDWVKSALKQVNLAFNFKKPAIISSHRLNYVEGLDISNKAKNLKLLCSLLKEVVNKHPDVRFMTTSQLLLLYSNNEN